MSTILLHDSIKSIVKKEIPHADQAALENIVEEIGVLFDEKLKQGVEHFSKQYRQTINQCCEPGSEMDRRLRGELGDMEKVLIANLSALR